MASSSAKYHLEEPDDIPHQVTNNNASATLPTPHDTTYNPSEQHELVQIVPPTLESEKAPQQVGVFTNENSNQRRRGSSPHLPRCHSADGPPLRHDLLLSAAVAPREESFTLVGTRREGSSLSNHTDKHSGKRNEGGSPPITPKNKNNSQQAGQCSDEENHNNNNNVSTSNNNINPERFEVGQIVFPPASYDAIKPFYPAKEVDWVNASLERSSIFGFKDEQVQKEYLQFLYRDVTNVFMSLVYACGGSFLAATRILIFDSFKAAPFTNAGISFVCATIELFVHLCVPIQSDFVVQIRRFCCVLSMSSIGFLCGPFVYPVFIGCNIQFDYLKQFGIDPGRADMPNVGSPAYIKSCISLVLPYCVIAGAMTIPRARIQLPMMWLILIVHYILWQTSYPIWGDEFITPRAMGAQVLLSLVFVCFALGFTYIKEQLHQDQFVETAQLEKNLRLASNAAEQVDKLLCSMLPPSVLSRVLSGDVIQDMTFAGTVFSSDMKSYTAWSSTKTPAQVVELLNELCISSDRLSREIGIEKITTIGDAYIAEAGLPTFVPDHAVRVVRFALLYQENVVRVSKMKKEWNGILFRVGVHSGAFNGTILGSQMRYTVFGETCDISEQIEKEGLPGKVIISVTTAAFLNKASHHNNNSGNNSLQQGRIEDGEGFEQFPTFSINPWYRNNIASDQDHNGVENGQEKSPIQNQAFIELDPDSVLNVSASRGANNNINNSNSLQQAQQQQQQDNPSSSRSSSQNSANPSFFSNAGGGIENKSNIKNNNGVSHQDQVLIQEVYSSVQIVNNRLLLYEVEFTHPPTAYANYYENFEQHQQQNNNHHQHPHTTNNNNVNDKTRRHNLHENNIHSVNARPDTVSVANSVASSQYRNVAVDQTKQNKNNNQINNNTTSAGDSSQESHQNKLNQMKLLEKEKRRKFIQEKMKEKLKAEEERKSRKLALQAKASKHVDTDNKNGSNDVSTAIAFTASTVEEIEQFYSKRKWNWILLDFLNCEDEYREFARKKMRGAVLWCRGSILVIAVCIMIAVGIEKKDFGVASACLLPISVVGAIIVLLATYFYPQHETWIALSCFVVMALVCVGAALIPESMASNDVTYLVMFFATVLADGMTSVAALWRCATFALVLEIPVIVIQWRTAMTPANLVFEAAATVLVFAVVVLAEKVLRRQFIEHIVASEYSKKTVESGAEQRALLETSLPAHVIPDLMEWMENDMAPEKSVAKEERISICFAKLIPRRAPTHSASSLSEEILHNNNNNNNHGHQSPPMTQHSHHHHQHHQQNQQQQQESIIREIFSEQAAWLSASHVEVDQIMNSLRQQHLESGSNPFSIIKIKIIGDVLMLAGNCGASSMTTKNLNNNNNQAMNGSFSPSSNDFSHSMNNIKNKNTLSASCFDMLELIERLANSSNNFTVKCGMHVGDVVSAVIGEDKISYDTFSDAVNVSSRILYSILQQKKPDHHHDHEEQEELKITPDGGEKGKRIILKSDTNNNHEQQLEGLIFAAASEEFCIELGLYQPEENSAVVSYTLGDLRGIEAKGKGTVSVRTVNV